MKMMYKFILIVVFCFTSSVFSQENAQNEKIIITGKIIEKSSKKPSEYATIGFKIAKDKNLVYGAITDEQGNFSLKIKKGSYFIEIGSLGFKEKNLDVMSFDKDYDFGIIKLEEIKVSRKEKKAQKEAIDKAMKTSPINVY